ncbi:hypothetical protein KM043_010808 [Ampulex compressa]|nr:hypothetical protein KM043_010808 [Ampulex compressa]
MNFFSSLKRSYLLVSEIWGEESCRVIKDSATEEANSDMRHFYRPTGSRKLCRGGTPRNTMATPPDGMLAQLEELKAPKHAASFDKPQARSRMLRTDRRELPYQLSGRRLVRSSSRLRNARFFH